MPIRKHLLALGLLLTPMLETVPTVYSAEPPPAADSYTPTAENLAMRQWFRDARFGMFIHWGVYSVLGDGEWVMHNQKITTEEYGKLPARFNPTKFDAVEWVQIAKSAGMKYITITSKHHDGFAMWDSKVTDWDIVDRTPYKKDVLKSLADQCAKEDIQLFFYHSHLDWHHPDYFPRGRTGQHSGRLEHGEFAKYLDFMDSQLAELCSGDYGTIAGIWFDGWWDQRISKEGAAPTDTQVDWRLSQTYDLIHRLQPQAMIGNNHHVTPFPGEDFQMFERDLPGENVAGHSADATISDLPLETCDTMNGAWGYNATDKKFKSVTELIHYLVRAAGHDANLLLNVGPMPDGRIQPEFVQRLGAMGEWTAKYGESIYATRGGPVSPQAWGASTRRDNTVYVHVLQTADGELCLSGTAGFKFAKARLFDGEPIQLQRNERDELVVQIPKPYRDQPDMIIVLERFHD